MYAAGISTVSYTAEIISDSIEHYNLIAVSFVSLELETSITASVALWNVDRNYCTISV